jgi:site-specific recombinase XerD
VKFYRKKLKYFAEYCEGQAVTEVSQLTSDLIRRYILELQSTHNSGGVHACSRLLRTLLYWVEQEEIMTFDWNNLIRKVKAPKLP